MNPFLDYMDPLIDFMDPLKKFSRDVMDALIDLLKITWIPLYISLINYMARSL